MSLPNEILEAARSLGAGAFARLRAVIWPHLRWAFLSATCQAWAFCAMSFALVLILGGGPPVQTLETEIYSRLRYGIVDLGGAMACALWELALTLIPWTLVLVAQARQGQQFRASVAVSYLTPESSPLKSWSKPLVAALFFTPYLAILFQPLIWPDSGTRAGLEFREALWVSLRLSFYVAIGTTMTAVASILFLSGLSGRPVIRAGVALALAVPGGVSALVLGLGLWLAYGRWMDPFSGSLIAMTALQVSIFFSVAYRILWPVAQQSPKRQLEAATTLGATPWQAFVAVEWPRWKRPLLASVGVVAGASLGEVAAVSLFYSEDLVPLPLLISRWMGQYRFEEAQAIAVLLLLSCAGIIALVFGSRWGTRWGIGRTFGLE